VAVPPLLNLVSGPVFEYTEQLTGSIDTILLHVSKNMSMASKNKTVATGGAAVLVFSMSACRRSIQADRILERDVNITVKVY